MHSRSLACQSSCPFWLPPNFLCRFQSCCPATVSRASSWSLLLWLERSTIYHIADRLAFATKKSVPIPIATHHLKALLWVSALRREKDHCCRSETRVVAGSSSNEKESPTCRCCNKEEMKQKKLSSEVEGKNFSAQIITPLATTAILCSQQLPNACGPVIER